MFGKFHMAVAGIAAAGLLASGTPASAAVQTAPGSPASDGNEGISLLRQHAAQARQMGARDASQLVRVQASRDRAVSSAGESSSVTQSAASTLAASPYVVWVQNQTSVTLEVKLYWVQSNVSGTLTGSALLNGGAEAPYVLGGDTGCLTVLGYILEIWFQGEFYVATGVVEPSADDGYLCSDFWGVS